MTTLATILELVTKDYKDNERKSLATMVISMKHVRDYFGDALASDLKTADFERYKDARRVQKAAKATINLELAIISRAYTLALRIELVDRKPYIPKYILGRSNRRKGWFERDDRAAIRAHLPPWMQDILDLGGECGWREGEIFKLTWEENYDANGQIISIYDSKSGEGRVLPLLDRKGGTTPARVVIARRLAERRSDTPFIFYDPSHFAWAAKRCRYLERKLRQGDIGASEYGVQRKAIAATAARSINRTTFNKLWRKACKAARVYRHFHDLRRTVPRDLILGLTPKAVAKKLTGHKTDWVFDWYTIIEPHDVQDALERMRLYRAMQETPATPKVELETKPAIVSSQPINTTKSNDSFVSRWLQRKGQ